MLLSNCRHHVVVVVAVQLAVLASCFPGFSWSWSWSRHFRRFVKEWRVRHLLNVLKEDEKNKEEDEEEKEEGQKKDQVNEKDHSEGEEQQDDHKESEEKPREEEDKDEAKQAYEDGARPGAARV